MSKKPERAGAYPPIPVQLPVFEHKGQLVADSRDVAVFAEKDHAHLLRDIRRYVRVMEKEENPNLDSRSYFIPATYVTEQGKELPCCYCTEMGCELVAHKMTGDKGVVFTAQYVKAFHAMREELVQRRELRAIGKPIRRSLTDALRDSGEVERMKGHAYGTYTNLAFKLATGKTAHQIREERGTGKDTNALDFLTAAELATYQRKEAAITVLLDAGLCYDTIKAVLAGEVAAI